LKAAERTVLCPGDLHLVLFHTLSPIYKIFYGGFLQPIKVALGMKRIEWGKIEKCYEQSSLMVLLILGRVESRLMEVYVCSLGSSVDDPKMAVHEHPMPDISAHYVATRFDDWLDSKIATSPDPWFRCVCHFTKMARHYRLFKESLRNGDVIAVEMLLVDFIGVFACIGKPKCLESSLCTIEEWYGKIPYFLLQLIRDNRTVKLYDGRQNNGKETAERPIDEIMELKNAAYSSMKFPPSAASWETHSQNVSLVKQSSIFVETEYKRKKDVDAMDAYNNGKKDDGDGHDTMNKKKGSVTTSRTDQKQLIDEILSLSSILVETPGRSFDLNQIWSILGETTTILGNKEEEQSIANHVTGEDEELLSGIHTEMQEFRSVMGGGGTSNVYENNSDDNEMINILPDADAEDEEATIDLEDHDSGISANEESEVDVVEISEKGKKKKIKLFKVMMSQFADMDTYTVGQDKLSKIDLPLIRLKRKQREEREQRALHDNLYNFQTNIGSDFGAVIAQTKRAMNEAERPGFGRRYSIETELETMRQLRG
jgi:hypothetical protein